MNVQKDKSQVTNILTIDVEDWYMMADISKWTSYEDRVVMSTNKILDLLSANKTTATFFVLGYIAETHPELVESIKDKGHEIGTHGYRHVPITRQTPSEFESDLKKSIHLIKKITGDKVIGHRACRFSINESDSWALDILQKNGILYDSSIFPIKSPSYGVSNAPLDPYSISSVDITGNDLNHSLLEIPLSVYETPIINKNIPIAGGFYFRLIPYFFIKHAITKMNRVNRSAVIYIHPWELDPAHPKSKDFRWYHYYRLNSTELKLKKLLAGFKFNSVENAIGV